MLDIIVIGAGAAGISAAIYAKSRGKKVLVLEKDQIGGLAASISIVTHYAGVLDKESGQDFAKRLKDQAERSGIEIRNEEVKKVSLEGDIKKVKTDKKTYECQKVIIASGSTPKKLGVDGEDTLTGNGIYMNAQRDAEKYRGQNVYVVGAGDGAIKEALYLSDFANKVVIIHHDTQIDCIQEFKDKLKEKDNISIRLYSQLVAVSGSEKVEKLDILNLRSIETDHIFDTGCGIFIYAGSTPNSEIFKGLDLDEKGYIKTDDKMKTSIEGVYAIGDVRVKDIRQISTAVADGTIAAIEASK